MSNDQHPKEKSSVSLVNKPVAQVQVELPLVTIDELSKRNSAKQAWISVNGLVWDVTQVLSWHPGGQKIILDQAGKPDATSVFQHYHPMSILETTLGKKHIVGRLEQSEAMPALSEASVKLETKKVLVDVQDEDRLPWVSLKDAELEAQKKAPEINFAYWATGAEDEMTVLANEAVFRKYCWFKPHILRNVSNVDTSTTVFGRKVSSPIFISPMAIHGLASEDHAELCAYRAAKRANIIHIAAHLSSRPWEDFLISDGIQGTCPRFFQAYLPRSKEDLRQLIDRAEKCGFEALFVTVDSASVGKRERDIRTRNRVAGARATVAGTAPRLTQTSQWNDAFDFDDLLDLMKSTKLPVILKGIQRGDDAVRAVKAGVAGIMVSNHGGRNLDTTRPTLACLVEIVSALSAVGLRRKVPIFFDGGIRRGGDVLKALCCGADFVGVGRPILYGVAARGEEGALEVLNILETELVMAMKLVGCNTIKDADRTLVDYGVSYL